MQNKVKVKDFSQISTQEEYDEWRKAIENNRKVEDNYWEAKVGTLELVYLAEQRAAEKLSPLTTSDGDLRKEKRILKGLEKEIREIFEGGE